MPRPTDRWDREVEDFDRQFNRMSRFAMGWFVFVALMSIAVAGVAIWAIVKLVEHFT